MGTEYDTAPDDTAPNEFGAGPAQLAPLGRIEEQNLAAGAAASRHDPHLDLTSRPGERHAPRRATAAAFSCRRSREQQVWKCRRVEEVLFAGGAAEACSLPGRHGGRRGGAGAYLEPADGCPRLGEYEERQFSNEGESDEPSL